MKDRDPVQEIELLEDERYAAMRAKDLATLDRLLHEDLLYVHSSGATDTKRSYIASVRDHVWEYRQIRRDEQVTRTLGPVALVFNRLHMDTLNRGVAAELDNRALAVWVRTDGPWRLIAVQSGIAEPSAQ
jgi:ketosteroid isomerase-like protein